MIEKLDDTNFLLYAAKNYNNLCYDTVEFYDDLKRIKYIRRLFNAYQESGELKERLILNHLITMYNVFGPEATTRMLFFRLFEYRQYLKPFLSFLNYLPDKVMNIGLSGTNINTTEIDSDKHIEEKLRSI